MPQSTQSWCKPCSPLTRRRWGAPGRERKKEEGNKGRGGIENSTISNKVTVRSGVNVLVTMEIQPCGGMIKIPSVLWRCWLGGRKRIPPVKKTEWWGASVVVCLERGADLHTAQLKPLPLTVSCFSKIQIGLPFWYRLPGSPDKKGR